MKSWTRRDFAGTTVAGISSAMGWAIGDDKVDNGWVDAHVHVWTPDKTACPLSKNFSEKEMAPPSFTPEELFAEQEGTGVTRTVLIQMSFYEFDNSYMLDVMKKYPGRFGGVAIIDHEAAEVDGEMKKLKEGGVRGFRLYAFPDRVAKWEASEGMNTMWKVGAEEGLAMCCLTDPASLPVIKRMCETYPDTTVVIDHFARIGMKGTVDPEQVEQLQELAKFPNTYVKTSAFYALGEKKPPYTDLAPLVKSMVEAYGSDRLMWGSDCPYQVQEPHTYKASIELMTGGLDFLSDKDRENMLRNTAEKIFFS